MSGSKSVGTSLNLVPPCAFLLSSLRNRRGNMMRHVPPNSDIICHVLFKITTKQITAPVQWYNVVFNKQLWNLARPRRIARKTAESRLRPPSQSVLRSSPCHGESHAGGTRPCEFAGALRCAESLCSCQHTLQYANSVVGNFTRPLELCNDKDLYYRICV